MTIKFKDASDFSGRTVNENLYNIVLNSDRLSKATEISLSWHWNAFNRQASGSEAFHYPGDRIGKEIATGVSAILSRTMGIPNRGAKASPGLYVVDRSQPIMILIEVCFIDNAYDMQQYNKNKIKLWAELIKYFASLPYTFTSTHGGHYGFNMMDPGAVGNGQKEAVLAQEINKYMLTNKVDQTAPTTPPTASYTELKEGDTVTLQKTATQYADGKYIADFAKGKNYKITGKMSKVKSKSKRAYRLTSGSTHIGWVLEQDVKLVIEGVSGKWGPRKGTFIPNINLPLTVDASGKGAVIATIKKGDPVVFDAVMTDSKYVWIRQPRSGGKFGYMATGYAKNGKRVDTWGTFK